MERLRCERPGHSALLLGNEAIVRGALEAGIGFATGYPGTPSSEVTDGFAALAEPEGLAFEYAVNEKIALELAYAASLAGARSICAMKHLGLMVAGDALSTICYTGVRGGLVIVSAGDPSCLTSPNEQDQRHLGRMLHLPVLDPAHPAEARELTLKAFELSEATRLPVLMRITTRVAHSRAAVPFGPRQERRATGFERDPARLIPVPHHARALRVEIQERMAVAAGISEQLFVQEGRGRTAILAAGAPGATVADLLDEVDAEDIVLARVPCVHPLPLDAIEAVLRDVERVLIVEELSPFVEDAVLAMCAARRVDVTVLGKRSGAFPEAFEYVPDVLRAGLHTALGLGPDPATSDDEPAEPPDLPEAENRPPVLCPACPHRSTFFAARAAFDEDQLFFNDIGCYTLGFAPPLGVGDALLCMGAGFSLASGVAQVTGERTVGFLGDSTFFHAGMPPLLDAIKEGVDMVAVILDNEVTAMTGFQESPGKEAGPKVERKVSIEGVARALGADHVETFDPMDLKTAIEVFERAKAQKGVSVLVAESPCPVHHKRAVGAPLHTGAFQIDPSMCGNCGRDERGLACGQPSVPGTERNMVRSRSLEVPGCGASSAPPALSPCAEQCPLGICIQGYAGHVAAGAYDLALELIMQRAPLPDTVCRVCHRPCEDVCVRGSDGGPVAVNDLKRFVMAQFEGDLPFEPELEPDHGRSVAVVGAGPAGLCAAYELRLRGYAVTLYDREEHPGGLLRSAIPRFRLPLAALERDVDRILALGVRFEPNRELGGDLLLSELVEAHDAVLLAVGAHASPRPELAPKGVDTDALAFLREEGDLSARDVVVVGGGNAGVDVARLAVRRGAATVTVVEQQAVLPALAHEVDLAIAEGVVFRAGVTPHGRDSAGVWCRDGDASIMLPADVVVAATGQRVQHGFLADGDPALTREGDVVASDPETAETSHPRVFVAGDVTLGGRTVTEAMGQGQRAAWGIDRSLRGEQAADHRSPPPPPGDWGLPTGPIDRRRPHAEARVAVPELPVELRVGSAEVAGVLDEATAQAEARRCMLCGSCGTCRACLDTFGCPAFHVADGRIQIDTDLCTGCGVCAIFCPNQAIVPVDGPSC